MRSTQCIFFKNFPQSELTSTNKKHKCSITEIINVSPPLTVVERICSKLEGLKHRMYIKYRSWSIYRYFNEKYASYDMKVISLWCIVGFPSGKVMKEW